MTQLYQQIRLFQEALTMWEKGDQPTNQELQKAVRRSFLLGLQSIVTECRAELIGPYPQQHRGNPVYPSEHEDALHWLDQKLKELKGELKRLDETALSEDRHLTLDTAKSLLTPAPQSATEQIRTVKQNLLNEALTENCAPCYVEKAKQESSGLFERMCAYFAFEIKHTPAIHAIFSGQLLVQINTQLSGLVNQQISVQKLENLLRGVAQDVPQVLTKLDNLETAIQQGNYQLGQSMGEVLAVSTSTAAGIEEIKALIEQLLRTQQEKNSGLSVFQPVNAQPLPPNPFMPLSGRIDDEALFFGRKREISQIFEILNSGSSVALIGARGMGKSSLLKAIYRQTANCLNPSRQSIYINLQVLHTEDDFYSDLCKQADIPDVRGGMLTRALQEREPQLLLLLDEVERFKGFTRQVREFLRGFADGGSPPLRLIVAACTPLDRLFADSESEEMTSPLAGICLEERLENWDEATTRAFITARLAPTPIQFEEAEIARLWRESQGHPKHLMQLCRQAYARQRENK